MRDPPEFSSQSTASRPLILVVEGANDLSFLQRIAAILIASNPVIPDLNDLIDAGLVVAIPIGGNPLAWTSRLASLGCRELHLLDRERPPEDLNRLEAARRVNRRRGCRAFLTRYRSLENYLHPAAIEAAGGGCIHFSAAHNVPEILAELWHDSNHGPHSWASLDSRMKAKKEQRTKRWLNASAVQQMTTELLAESDPEGDLQNWLSVIGEMVPTRGSHALATPFTMSGALTEESNCDNPPTG